MPGANVIISDIVVIDLDEFTSFETTHPYANNQNDVVIGEKTFEGAKSLTVILDYQTQGINYDYFYIYNPRLPSTQRYGGSNRKKEIITINGDSIIIRFISDSSDNIYYGLKAIVIPNY